MTSLFDYFRTLVSNIANGTPKEFEQLVKDGDIDKARASMATQEREAVEAMQEYDTDTHRIMLRPDKEVKDKHGNRVRLEKTWKLPVPYPAYINEIALVFLYGRPVKWTQLSDNTDRAFTRFTDTLRSVRFDSKIRQCKRLAGAETEAALLFRTYKDADGKAAVQARVLARSLGDDIRTRFDIYGNLTAAAWGYHTKDIGGRTSEHFDIYTAAAIHRCTRSRLGWDVRTEDNAIGKIPIIIFRQQKEWAGVERLIEREEHIASNTADTNDYYADPIMIVAADAIRHAPEKREVGKLLITDDPNGVSNAARYLTWDSAPQSKKDEMDWLQDQILSKTFTPRISLDTLKSLGNLSAKALRTVMLLADIKAARHKEQHDELLDRTASLVTAIIANVLDISLASECSKLRIGHEFQNPFGDDIKDTLDNLIHATEAGILSTETATETNPLAADPAREKERLAAEQSARQSERQSVFGNPDGNGGAQAFD